MKIDRAVAQGLGALALGTMLVAASFGLTVTAASADPGDYCAFGIDQPGVLDADDMTCIADATFTPSTVGKQCGATGTYYNGSMCVADAAACQTTSGADGVYNKGTCQISYAQPTPAQPTSTTGFAIDPNAGQTPSGTLEPMCVDGSPFIGGGIFVVTGAVLCYEGAGRPTGIYAYTDDGANSNGWNPFDRDSWDSLTVAKDIYAGDDITALGTLSAFGGAQIYSLNGRNGIQVNDSNVLIRSSGLDGREASLSTKPGEINAAALDGLWSAGVRIEANDAIGSEIGRVSTVATNGTSAASTTVDATGKVVIAATDGTSNSSIETDGATGIRVQGQRDTGGPAVRIDGQIGAGSDARIGTAITGSGQGNQSAPVSGPASWADVLIGSDSYTLDGNLGAGIQVSDHGVVVRSAALGNSYNEFGSGARTQSDASITNVIGAGGRGTVYNLIGEAGLVGSIVVNEIGTGNAGGATTNLVGNTNASTRVGVTAGTSSMTIIQGALDLGTNRGTSILTNPSQQTAGGSSTAMWGSKSRHIAVDANGRMTIVDGVAAQATSSMYIVNGRGTTNGVVVTETASTLSGGERTPTPRLVCDVLAFPVSPRLFAATNSPAITNLQNTISVVLSVSPSLLVQRQSGLSLAVPWSTAISVPGNSARCRTLSPEPG